MADAPNWQPVTVQVEGDYAQDTKGLWIRGSVGWSRVGQPYANVTGLGSNPGGGGGTGPGSAYGGLGSPRIGVYDGNAGEETTKATFGTYPEIATSYYNYNQATINQTNEKNRLNKGIDTCITWDTKVNTGGTTAQNAYLVDMANGSGTGYTAMEQYITALTAIAKTADSAGRHVVATIDHEFENNWHQGKFLPAVTGDVYAAAMSRFWSEVKQAAPSVIRSYWTGYYNFLGDRNRDTTQVITIGAKFTTYPDIFTMDPYMESGTQTLDDLAAKYVAQVQSMPWWQAHPIPIGISETGSQGFTDQQYATFLTGQHAVAVRNGLAMVVNFNRNAGGTLAHAMTPAADPLAVAAESASLAGA